MAFSPILHHIKISFTFQAQKYSKEKMTGFKIDQAHAGHFLPITLQKNVPPALQYRGRPVESCMSGNLY